MKSGLFCRLLPVAGLLLIVCCTAGQRPIPFSPADQAVWKRYLAYADSLRLEELPEGERIAATARFFLNTPYVAGTLERNDTEQLTVNLRELDCVTLVDNVLALCQSYPPDAESPGRFLQALQRLRYRNGEIAGYASRLHYSGDWLYEMNRQGILRDVTPELGGIPFPNRVHYISRHAAAYPALRRDSTLIPRMAAIEEEINSRQLYYLPKEELNQALAKLQTGDIILITTCIDGLDTAHLGIALRREGSVYLLHASSTEKKVVITEVPLDRYISAISRFTGAMVGRSHCPGFSK